MYGVADQELTPTTVNINIVKRTVLLSDFIFIIDFIRQFLGRGGDSKTLIYVQRKPL